MKVQIKESTLTVNVVPEIRQENALCHLTVLHFFKESSVGLFMFTTADRNLNKLATGEITTVKLAASCSFIDVFIDAKPQIFNFKGP